MLFIERLMGMFSKDLGIDLGTANTLVALKGEGVVLSEPSYVAVEKGTNKVLLDGMAVGIVAKEMAGRPPKNIEVIRPMKNGVIADFEITQAMLTYFINKTHRRKWGIKPRVVISVPYGVTAVEKRAVYSSAERAGARKVYLLEQPRAAGIGAGLPIQEPIGSLILDIGGGTTDIAVLSLGDIVVAKSLRIAGDAMDDAIVQHIKRAYNLLIGDVTAEDIKIKIGSAFPLENELTMEARGKDIVGRVPRSQVVSSEEIREALREPLEAIIEAVKEVLEITPPELSADLIDNGMVLAGGGALLRGLDKLIAQETGLPVRVAEDPLGCVARGTGIFLEHLDRYSNILESSDR
jgi:rod shape-determining protein MreB